MMVGTGLAVEKARRDALSALLLGLLTLLYMFGFSWFDHLLTYHVSYLYITLIVHCLSPPPTVECKFHNIRSLFLSCSPMYPQHPEQGLEYSKCSINIWWMSR